MRNYLGTTRSVTTSKSILFMLVFACALLSGCTEQTVNGDTTTFSWSTWVPLAVIAGGVIGLIGGLALRTMRLGWVLMVLGVGCLGVVAPMMFSEKVTVDKQHFSMATGFWFAPNAHDVKFADLKKIEIVKRQSRRGESSDLECVRKNGDVETVPVSNLMQQGAEKFILEKAHVLKIPVEGEE